MSLDLSHDVTEVALLWAWRLANLIMEAGQAGVGRLHASFDAVLLLDRLLVHGPVDHEHGLDAGGGSNDTALMAGFCPVLEPTGSGTRPGADAVACGAREATSSCFASMAVRRSPDAVGRVVAGWALPAVSSARS